MPFSGLLKAFFPIFTHLWPVMPKNPHFDHIQPLLTPHFDPSLQPRSGLTQADFGPHFALIFSIHFTKNQAPKTPQNGLQYTHHKIIITKK
jgi:hypothetical protein